MTDVAIRVGEHEPLTLEHVRKLAYEIVSSKDDTYQYPIMKGFEGKGGSCHYERDGQPSCLIGQILSRSGYSVEELSELDASSNTAISDLMDDGIVPVADDKTSSYLDKLQFEQDHNTTWHGALNAAELLLKEERWNDN